MGDARSIHGRRRVWTGFFWLRIWSWGDHLWTL